MKRVYFVEGNKGGVWKLVKFPKQDEKDGWHTYHKTYDNASFIAGLMNTNLYCTKAGWGRVRSKMVSNTFYNRYFKED